MNYQGPVQGPVWERIATVLRGEIASGTRPPGSFLPSETALARQWQVSRMTARRVLQALESEGLIWPSAGPGRPRRVATGRPEVTIHINRRSPALTVEGEGITGGADSWQADMRRTGREPTQKIDPGREMAGPELAGHLGIDQGAIVVTRRLIRLADGKPDNLITFWYPLAVARGTHLEDPGDITEGAVAWLERTRGPLTHEALIELAAATDSIAEESARALSLPPMPMLVVWRVSHDRDGEPVVASRAIYPQGTRLRIA